MEAMRPAQQQQHHIMPSYPAAPSAPVMTLTRNEGGYNNTAYPSLRDFMGLELSEEMIRLNMPEYFGPVAVPQPNSG